MADHRMYRRSRLTSPKGPSQHIFKHYKYFCKYDCILVFSACSRERGRKTKTTKLIVGGIGSTWVQLERLERVNGLRWRLCLKWQFGVRGKSSRFG
ncbi:hypothetical protein H5410_051424, partial [Solanum commersonii]